MCNIISNQKQVFACKGICPNCRRKSELTASKPERGVVLLTDFILRPQVTSVILTKAYVPAT